MKKSSINQPSGRMQYQSPRGPRVLDSTDQDAQTVHRLISGFEVTNTVVGFEVTPWITGYGHCHSYETSMVKKSSPGNAGRIFFRSNNTDYTIREVLLEDADWLFPGQEFASAAEVVSAIEQKLRRDSNNAVESKQEGTTSD